MSSIRKLTTLKKLPVNERPMNKQSSQIRKNRGFTLLEALIGFLILSTGMMGIASLQAISLKAGKTSVYNSVAMMKVDELLENMRANPMPVALAAYDAAGEGSGVNNTCAAVVCTPGQLAQEDIFWWKKNLSAELPSTATTVVVYTPAIPPSRMATVQVDVNWSERNKDTGASVAKVHTTTVDICTNDASTPC